MIDTSQHSGQNEKTLLYWYGTTINNHNYKRNLYVMFYYQSFVVQQSPAVLYFWKIQIQKVIKIGIELKSFIAKSSDFFFNKFLTEKSGIWMLFECIVYIN